MMLTHDATAVVPPSRAAGAGLLLVIEIFGGGQFHLVGTAWALGAMVGCAAYFVISADETTGLPLLLLGVVTAAVAYTSGIAAGRRLGSRLASFIGLNEVLAAVLFAWLLLGEFPSSWQLVGGVLILVGVVAVKSGERSVVRAEPLSA